MNKTDNLILNLRNEIADLKKKLAKALKEKKVIIEVGGDHGDGNVELVRKSKGVKVIIKDWDNATLPKDDENTDPIPEIREY